jgi:protochlorophyllide reductase
MMRLLTLFLAASTAGAFAPSQRAMRTTTTTTTTTTPFVSRAPFSQSPVSATQLAVAAQQSAKLYDKAETPKVLGGLKIGNRELVVITGASSGLGLSTAANLAKTGKYYVVMAVRDTEKAKEGTSRVKER